MSTDQATEDIGWAILELMGHRKLAGFVTDDMGLVRIDVYTEDPEVRMRAKPIATQWYGRAAIYCITASTVGLCVEVARSHQPAPVGRWELPETSVGSTPPSGIADAEMEPDFDDGQAY